MEKLNNRQKIISQYYLITSINKIPYPISNRFIDFNILDQSKKDYLKSKYQDLETFSIMEVNWKNLSVYFTEYGILFKDLFFSYQNDDINKFVNLIKIKTKNKSRFKIRNKVKNKTIKN